MSKLLWAETKNKMKKGKKESWEFHGSIFEYVVTTTYVSEPLAMDL